MSGTEKILEQMRKAPTNVRFADLQKVCEAYLERPDKAAAVTLSTRRPGKEIHG